MKTANPRRHRGFTLVELLVVIAIIGILAAILIPTLYRVVIKARQNVIAQELNQLHLAIESYKQKFGDYPPDLSDQTKVVTHLRKAFPRHNDVMTNTGITLPDGSDAQDIATGTRFDVTQLDPSEALVFWLAMLKNDPRQPLNGSGDRTVLFPFDAKRLQDLDGDGWLSYVPPSGKSAPYVYFESRTYNFGFPPNQPSASTPTFPVPPPCRWPSLPPRNQPNVPVGVIYPFQTDRPPPVPPPPLPDFWTNYKPNMTWANGTTFQIITAGLDGEFGPDTYGTPSPPLPNAHKILPSKNAVSPSSLNWSVEDYDNIANFSDGKIFEDFLE